MPPCTERDKVILSLLDERGYVSLPELSDQLNVSSTTLRRDLGRLQLEEKLSRVRGGAILPDATRYDFRTRGGAFHESIDCHRATKVAIGRAAASLCAEGDAIIIDGGSTTLQMCSNLEHLGLQVLTNSLHVASVLLFQANTRISITGGTVFREQSILLDPFDNAASGDFHASRAFVGAAAVNRHGLFQNDIILVQAQRKLLALADEIVALVDSSKFTASAGTLLCALSKVHTLITDDRISVECAKMVEREGIRLITVKSEPSKRLS